MDFRRWIKRLFTVDDSILDVTFSLGEREDAMKGSDGAPGPGQSEGTSAPDRGKTGEAGEADRDRNGDDGKAAKPVDPRRPIPWSRWVRKESRAESGSGGGEPDAGDDPIPTSIDKVEEMLNQTFTLPQNKDVVVRNLTIGLQEPRRALLVFVDGLVDKVVINHFILEPLMLLASVRPGSESAPTGMEQVLRSLVPGNQVERVAKFRNAVKQVLMGNTLLFIEGVDEGLAVETKGWDKRSVSDPKSEQVIRGPHEAFTENFRTNTALIRVRLRSPRLVTEILQVGQTTKNDVAIMYLRGIANPKLVEEVKRRVNSLRVDALIDSGLLEQYLEDPPSTVVPKILSTERPDRVVSFLVEGHVALLVSGSPYALVVPVSFWALLHTPEDAYLRWPFGSFIRVIRFVSLLIAVLLPGLYIGVANYHPEMLPTDLMMAIAGSREKVPFPVIGEVLMMELAIELIREAGIRIPSVIGPTIGIVGALILGQAAVQASIISPVLVIVVSVTALASFTTPNYNLSFAVRVLRFIFIALAGAFGFYGMTLGIAALLANLVSAKSFGVPLMSPVAPHRHANPDIVMRGRAYEQELRPEYLRTGDPRMQDPINRRWDPWSAAMQSDEPNEGDGKGRMNRGEAGGGLAGGAEDGHSRSSEPERPGGEGGDTTS
ncbi:MAG: spore germination protein [Kyrpidia sp.]|nr:spore germination protein [Kyrpidia sp.]